MRANAEFQVVTRKPAPTPRWFDLTRLDELRSQHEKLHGEYRRAGESVRATQSEMARIRVSLSGEPESEQVLALPTAQLAALSLDKLDEVKLDPRAIQKLVMLDKRLASQMREHAELTAHVQRSVAYMERVEEFAKANRL